MERVILHSDLNNFYASVECLDDPSLRGKPVAVCGDPALRHGIVLAKSGEAKSFGVATGQAIWEARLRCPGLVVVPPRYGRYLELSRQVRELYLQYTDQVEPFGLDESWLDVGGSAGLFGDGRQIADTLRTRIRREIGLTVSVGVSFNKVFAKMGSDYKKPDATTVITRENFRQLLWPLPVTDLLFVGSAAARTLAGYGIHTIGDLAVCDREALVSILGKQGATLHAYATGAEHSSVLPARDQPPPKSVGNGSTFRRDLTTWTDIRAAVTALSDQVAARLRREGMKCTAVQVTIRDPNFRDICRQKRLIAPSCVSRDIAEAALALIEESWNVPSPIRALTVTGQNLLPEGEAAEQLSLFAREAIDRRDKLEKLERAVDGLRARFGRGAVGPASGLEEDTDPGDGPGFHPERE